MSTRANNDTCEVMGSYAAMPLVLGRTLGGGPGRGGGGGLGGGPLNLIRWELSEKGPPPSFRRGQCDTPAISRGVDNLES